MKTKVSVLPIWKITVKENIYYFALGMSKKTIIDNITSNSENLILDGQYITITLVDHEESKKILLQVDLEDDVYTTLFNEAKYYTEHNLERDFFLATSFDVVADLNLK